MVRIDSTPWDSASGFTRTDPVHVTVTDAHHELALQVLWPMTTLTFAELKEYERWRAGRVAQAIADAEVRGPAGGREDLARAEEAAFLNGLGRGFNEAIAAIEVRARGVR